MGPGKPLKIVIKKVYVYDSLHKDVDIQCIMPLSIYSKIETIKDMMYLQALIITIFKKYSVPINCQYWMLICRKLLLLPFPFC